MTVPRWALFTVDLWFRSRSAAPVIPPGIRGPAPLPCAGAWQDQPAALLDAFALLDCFLAAEQE